MNYIQPKKLSWDFIRNKAEEFRQKYVKPVNTIPVPIIDIVEIQLKIYPIPIPDLKKRIDVESFLSSDLQNIYIDQDIYLDERYETRLRFSYAHEVGHLILHKDEIQKCSFRNENDWIHFREDMLEDDLSWFEQQAYEFAGRLLVPKNKLIEELDKNKDKIEKFKSLAKYIDEDLLIRGISNIICMRFCVSDVVIDKRIKKEKILKELNL